MPPIAVNKFISSNQNTPVFSPFKKKSLSNLNGSTGISIFDI
jgi:hypothetical protein